MNNGLSKRLFHNPSHVNFQLLADGLKLTGIVYGSNRLQLRGNRLYPIFLLELRRKGLFQHTEIVFRQLDRSTPK